MLTAQVNRGTPGAHVSMKIAVASDHAGYDLKDMVIEQLRSDGHEVLDLGAHQLDPEDDYPDYARYVGQAIQHGQAERGVLLCGSGVGGSIAANKLRGVRASVCHDTYSAAQGVEHDDMNVLCLGARVIGSAVARQLLTAFLNARFSAKGRYSRRVEKITALEDTAG